MDSVAERTFRIKSVAKEAGFSAVGIAPATAVDGEARYRAWLAAGKHAGMEYMARNVDVRFHPEKLLPGAKSVICLAVGYAPSAVFLDVDCEGDAFIARYARGRDYHKVLKRQCAKLMAAISATEPEFSGRAFVDAGPIAERSLAARAGLGFIGGNGCLIVPGLGSYVLLCEIVCNLPLAPDSPMTNSCGDCRACIDACPNAAIGDDATVDAPRCLSYLTIEHRGEIAQEFHERMGLRVFGCDACQEVCPHNASLPAGDVELVAPREIAKLSLAEMLAMTSEDFDAVSRGSAVRRCGHEGLLRNAIIAAGNSGDGKLIEWLERLAVQRPEFAALANASIGRLRANSV
jgi:epoxyqueuosine reductase